MEGAWQMTYRTPGTELIGQEIVALHKQGLRQFQIAEKVGIDRQAVRYHLIKAGVIPKTPPPSVPNAKGYKSENHPNYKLIKKYVEMNYGSKRIAEKTGMPQSNVIFWMRKIKKGSVRTPLYIKDHQDRRTLEGFEKYYKDNPIRFKEIYGNISIRQAYKEAHGLVQQCRKGKAEYFLEGIPEHKEQTDYSVGYDGR